MQRTLVVHHQYMLTAGRQSQHQPGTIIHHINEYKLLFMHYFQVNLAQPIEAKFRGMISFKMYECPTVLPDDYTQDLSLSSSTDI